LFPNEGRDGAASSNAYDPELERSFLETCGFYLAREYWGRGLATEAGRAFVDHGFATLGLRKIHAGMNAKNAASIRVIEKLGFTRVRSGEGSGNRWHDYELVNEGPLISSLRS
jgi:RimJ/RimL family protein N-acetyltransferase